MGSRYSFQIAIGFMLIDVDHFKAYNDHYGHTRGGDCLAAMARVLGRCIHRPGDLLARYGGEEFVVLLPETDHRGVLEFAERCCAEFNAVRMPHDYSNIVSHLTVSIGIATCPRSQEMSTDHLIEKADVCLYKAKRQGCNQVQCIKAPA